MGQLPPVRRQIMVPGPPETAFAVWTTEIGAWWPLDEHSVFGAGGTVSFVDGELVERSPDGESSVWGEVLEWSPPARLSLTWHPGGDPAKATRIEITFTPVAHDAVTLVTLAHHGWELYADPGAARDSYRQGWPTVLERFAALIPAVTGPQSEVGPGPYWLVLSHTVGIVPEGGSALRDPRFAEHIAFLRRLADDGVLVAAGSLPDVPGNGMTIVRVSTVDDLVRYTRHAQDDDGSVTGGLFDVQVRPWSVALAG